MADPFYDIIEADLARKCSADAADVLRRAFQLCDTQRGCVVVGVAGVGGAVASLCGAFYAAYPVDELTEEVVDIFWRELMRGIVVAAVADVSPALIAERQRIASLPAMPADVKGGGHG